MAKLTDAQRWALQAIRDGHGWSPSSLGQKMMERPGATPERRGDIPYKAQGYGRMGGAMANRLRKMGLVSLRYDATGLQWAATTAAGRAALTETKETKGGGDA